VREREKEREIQCVSSCLLAVPQTAVVVRDSCGMSNGTKPMRALVQSVSPGACLIYAPSVLAVGLPIGLNKAPTFPVFWPSPFLAAERGRGRGEVQEVSNLIDWADLGGT
jgi:hypothetical protein